MQVDKLVGDLVSKREACENAKMEEQNRQKRIRSLKVMPNSQAAFGFVKNSKKEVFTSWELTTGTYLSGNLRGTPRIPKKMQLNSACLLTECPRELTEKERKIIEDRIEQIFMSMNHTVPLKLQWGKKMLFWEILLKIHLHPL